MPKPASIQTPAPVKESARWLRFEYIMQTYGAAALLIIVILGLLGLFSDGLLSTKRLSNAQHTLTVEYEKMGRIDSDMNIKIETMAHGENMTLVLGGDWMRVYEITSLYPTAERMTSRNGELVLQYQTGANAAPFAVWIGVTPRHAGKQTYTLHTDDASLTFSQYILP
ncbi:hypothetical protein [Atlantibacter sp.]|uniref:hypothetical protein n=1 Tax=Atlantibacter sp. TaxID=1903473 RepID=UPI0028A1E5FC|nr:hypothetical protein [Atlantibacter sp.]